MKRIFSVILISLFPFFSFCFGQELNYPKKIIDGKEFYEYTVEKSEGLYSISKKFSVAQDEIKAVNPGTENGLLQGAILLVPVNKTDFQTHPVEKKETLFSLTQKYGVSYEDLYELNPTLKDEGLKYGTEIRIPKKTTVTAQTMVVNESVQQAKKTGQSGFLTHQTQKGETLFGISRTYGVSMEEIIRLNPDAKDGVKTGQMLIIPPAHPNTAVIGTNATVQTEENPANKPNKDYVSHEVKAGETLYSISKQYGITQDEIIRLNPDTKNGVQTGKILIIPPAYANTSLKESSNQTLSTGNATAAVADTVSSIPKMDEIFSRSTEPKKTINIALALPFQLDKVTQSSKTDSNTDKFLEFYQGMLLAVDSLKKSGLSFNLYVYDSGKTEIEIKNMLDKPELKNIDILIGPAYTAQIKPMSDFALMNNVKLIIPFSSRSDDTKTNPNIIQINTPQIYQYELFADLIMTHFPKDNVIFIRFKTDAYNDRSSLGDTVETILKAHNFSFKSVEYGTMENIKKEIVESKQNILIPLTTNQVALSQILPMLNMYGEKKPVSLFGFPEWQTYQSIIKELFRLNTYFATPFFIDYNDPDVKNYLKKYRSFYTEEPTNQTPQYSLLGYDITMFFSQAIAQYGHDFEKNLDKIDTKTLQMNFKFKRINSSGGYYNDHVFLLNCNDVSGTTVIKE